MPAALRPAARLLLAAALLVAVPAQAGDAGPDAELERIRDLVQTLLPEITRENVTRSAASGLYEVRRGNAFGYITADGRHFLRGELIDLRSGEVLTESRRRVARLEVLNRLSGRAIEFAPPADLAQHTVYVFADVDCEYCRELHREVRRVNALGIAVRYVFYPRQGPESEAFARAQSAYCAPEPRQTLDQLFAGGRLDNADSACDNPVAEQYAAALEIGVKGTPMIVLPDGSVHYGSISAERLQEAVAMTAIPPTPATPMAPR